MLLAEALNERKQIMEKIKTRQGQLPEELVIEEGDAKGDVPDPAGELKTLFDGWQMLTEQIQAANARTLMTVEGVETISMLGAITLRDRLSLEHKAIRTVADAVAAETGRRGRGRRRSVYGDAPTKDTLRFESLVDPKEISARADALAEQIRKLDIEIQKVNWTAEV